MAGGRRGKGRRTRRKKTYRKIFWPDRECVLIATRRRRCSDASMGSFIHLRSRCYRRAVFGDWNIDLGLPNYFQDGDSWGLTSRFGYFGAIFDPKEMYLLLFRGSVSSGGEITAYMCMYACVSSRSNDGYQGDFMRNFIRSSFLFTKIYLYICTFRSSKHGH